MLYKYRIEVRSLNDVLLYKTEQEYEIGKELMFKKVTEQHKITGARKMSLILSPEEAFGKKDPNLIKVYQIRIFGDEANKLYPGVIVKIGELQGRVVSIASGRVMVDHNHPFSGLSIKVDVEILGQINNKKEILEEIIKFHNLKLTIKEENNNIIIDGDEDNKQALKELLLYYEIDEQL